MAKVTPPQRVVGPANLPAKRTRNIMEMRDGPGAISVSGIGYSEGADQFHQHVVQVRADGLKSPWRFAASVHCADDSGEDGLGEALVLVAVSSHQDNREILRVC